MKEVFQACLIDLVRCMGNSIVSLNNSSQNNLSNFDNDEFSSVLNGNSSANNDERRKKYKSKKPEEPILSPPTTLKKLERKEKRSEYTFILQDKFAYFDTISKTSKPIDIAITSNKKNEKPEVYISFNGNDFIDIDKTDMNYGLFDKTPSKSDSDEDNKNNADNFYLIKIETDIKFTSDYKKANPEFDNKKDIISFYVIPNDDYIKNISDENAFNWGIPKMDAIKQTMQVSNGYKISASTRYNFGDYHNKNYPYYHSHLFYGDGYKPVHYAEEHNYSCGYTSNVPKQLDQALKPKIMHDNLNREAKRLEFAYTALNAGLTKTTAKLNNNNIYKNTLTSDDKAKHDVVLTSYNVIPEGFDLNKEQNFKSIDTKDLRFSGVFDIFVNLSDNTTAESIANTTKKDKSSQKEVSESGRVIIY